MTTNNITLLLMASASILYALLFASIAGRMLRRRSLRNWAGIQILGYILLSFLWTLGQLALQLKPLLGPGLLPEGLLVRLLLYAVIPLALLFLSLTRRFLTRRFVQRGPIVRRGLGWGGWLLGLVWLAVVVLLSEDWTALPGRPWDSLEWTLSAVDGLGVSRPWLAFILVVLGWGCVMAAATVLTIQIYRRTRQEVHRSRITYWGLAILLTLAGGVLFLAGFGGWGTVLHLLGSVSAVYLLLTHRLPDVRRTARSALSYMVVTLLMTFLYAGIFLGGYYALREVPDYPPLLVAVGLALLLVAVVHPLLDWVRIVMAGTASRNGRDPNLIVGEYSTLLSNLLDREDLAFVALGLVREALEIRNGTLFLVEWEHNGHRSPDAAQSETVGSQSHAGDSVQLRGVTGSGPDQSPFRLPAESPLVQYMVRRQRPLTQYALDLRRRFQTMPLREREWLSNLDMDVYVPICSDGEWIGLMGLGSKMSGEPYFDDDLKLLRTLANQTAVALQNARLFDELKAHHAEYERSNRELTAANQALMRLDRDKTDLLRIVADQVRKPPAAIAGYVDLLHELIRTGSLTPERGEEMTQGISSSVQRLEEIAETLSKVSRQEAETISLQVGPVTVESMILEAAAHWSRALKDRKLAFSALGLQDLPPIVADGGRLHQAFVELIQNAIKFTPDGGQIQVRGSLRDGDAPEGTQQIELVVADTGLGIGRDDLERVFDRFYRAGNVTLHGAGRTEFGAAGPGLGLGLVRKIVEAHGGRIWAASPGYDAKNCPGTEIHVVLPVRTAKK